MILHPSLCVLHSFGQLILHPSVFVLHSLGCRFCCRYETFFHLQCNLFYAVCVKHLEIKETSRIMKKIIFTLTAVVCLLALQSCGRKAVITSDDTVSRSYKVGEFEKIALYSVADVHYSQSDTASVRVVGTKTAIEKLQISVEKGTLKIGQTRRSRLFNIGDDNDVDVYISSPDLTGVIIKGAGDFDVDGHLDTDNLTVTVKGAGDINLSDVICDAIDIEVAGAGDVSIGNLVCQRSSLALRGVGDMDVNYESCDRAECRLMGVGSITLSGRVGSLKRELRGTGSIDTDDLTIGK